MAARLLPRNPKAAAGKGTQRVDPSGADVPEAATWTRTPAEVEIAPEPAGAILGFHPARKEGTEIERNGGRNAAAPTRTTIPKAAGGGGDRRRSATGGGTATKGVPTMTIAGETIGTGSEKEIGGRTRRIEGESAGMVMIVALDGDRGTETAVVTTEKIRGRRKCCRRHRRCRCRCPTLTRGGPAGSTSHRSGWHR